jgi:peptidoglycan/xylan/chitin deacetylase (PgdA/CDA1 family)
MGLILGYHRIAIDPGDPYGNCVTPGAFRSQLETLARVAEPVPLEALVSQSGGGPARVTLAFDDGYVDFAEQALPLLREFGVPATLFVVSEALGDPAFWWDRLSWALAHRCGERRFWELHDELASLEPAERAVRLDSLEEKAGNGSARSGETYGPGAARPMNTSELLAVADDPLVEIGAHSRTHPSLAALPADRLAEEIAGSRSDLEALLERPVTSFAYPHGSHSRAVRQVVREAGFDVACASMEGAVRQGEPPFALPRHWVPDLAGAEFEAWLRRRLPGAGRT